MANELGIAFVRPGSARTRRRPVACTFCRAKKIRCNGSSPCANCLDHGKTCVVARPHRTRLEDQPDEIRQRLNHLEALVVDAGGARASQVVSGPVIASTRAREAPLPSPHRQPLVFVQESPAQPSLHNPPVSELDGAVTASNDETDTVQRGSDGVYVTQAPSHEYFGPTSFLSLCSRPGIDWVNSKLDSEDFEPVATDLMTSMARRLKIEGSLPVARAPEPEAETAWRYSSAYFSDAVEAAFGIVDQDWFNARLKAHFRRARDDSSWYALRNAIFAAGCRIHTSKTAGFRTAKDASWALFENAMACLPHLLLYSSSIMDIQALTLMAYFSEGLSSPSLQYMLTSNAMRLACSMGLHRQSAHSWKMPRSEVEHRTRLFWSIYCLEKQTVSRSGRPSMIDDDDISCCLLGDIDIPPFCRLLVHLSQVSSAVSKRLSTASALRRRPAELATTVSELSTELNRFRTATSEMFGIEISQPLDSFRLPPGLNSRQALVIQFFYYCISLNIHTSLCRPWTYCTTGPAQKAGDATHICHTKCRTAIIEACRSIVLASRSVQIDAACPSLIAGFGVSFASICIFTHILHAAAESASCRSELLLLDIAIGCSYTLELQTEGEWSLSFIKDLRRIAGEVVERTATEHRVPTEQQDPDFAAEHPISVKERTTHSQRMNDDMLCPLERLPSFETPLADDLEMWSTLLQLPQSGDVGEPPW